MNSAHCNPVNAYLEQCQLTTVTSIEHHTGIQWMLTCNNFLNWHHLNSAHCNPVNAYLEQCQLTTVTSIEHHTGIQWMVTLKYSKHKITLTFNTVIQWILTWINVFKLTAFENTSLNSIGCFEVSIEQRSLLTQFENSTLQ